MKRFFSLATTAALAGSLLALGSAARATFNYNIVPVSPLNGVYKKGDTIQFAVTVTTTNPAITALSAEVAIAFDPTIVDANNITETPDQSLFPGKTTKLWNFPGPDSASTATSGSTVLSTFQATPGHTALKSGNTTLTIPTGTYTCCTFSVPILATTTATAVTIILPQAYGYYGPAISQDYVLAKVGSVPAADQGIPAFGTASLTYSLNFPFYGYVALEGVPNLSAINPGASVSPIHVALVKLGTTTEVSSVDISTIPAGTGNYVYYTLPAVPYDYYTVTIKGPKNLGVSYFTDLYFDAQYGGGLGYATLPAGDANGDNMVDVADFNILAGAYGTTYDANTPNSLTGYDPTADFNYDGQIDAGDFNLLVGNYGRVGD